MYTPTLDELRARADQFSKDFAQARYEMGEAQEFIRGLCEVYGLRSRLAVSFEARIKRRDGQGVAMGGINRIDGLFRGVLLIEMKSDGKNLDDAYIQARDYIPLIEKEEDKPRYILVSDFQNLRLYDRETPDAAPLAFRLAEFGHHVERLGFLCGYERIAMARQEKANKEAAEKLAALHDAILATGYGGQDLETLLMRLLFCLFADDTQLFGQTHRFTDYLKNHTQATGRDLYCALDLLFATLNTANGENQQADLRSPALYPELRPFPYVNGNLFNGRLAPCYFDDVARNALIACAEIDWAEISPDIFGSLFQAIMHFEGESAGGKGGKRREFGAHYTSEENIQKVIGPLFLHDLKTELKAVRKNARKLDAFLFKLRQLNLLDPACGCGNFLVVAYREIRLLEEEALDLLESLTRQRKQPECNVDQLHGIEIDPSASQIATVALWLTDHQMNLRVPGVFRRLPLEKRANIVCGNALRLDWATVLAADKCTAVLGNPPFVGHQWRTERQMADMEIVWGAAGRFGRLDYVTAWYNKAALYIKETAIPVAFVSTNSISQGEQVGTLWEWLLVQGIKIRFAHRSFRWSNEGRGIAAVHCVIIGFGMTAAKKPVIFEYADINGESIKIKARNINPYLVDAPNVILPSRTATPAGLPQLIKGSQPTDGGHLILTEAERAELLAAEPGAHKWLRRYVGGDELINGGWRWCLWLKTISEMELAALPRVAERVRQVALERSKSPTKSVREFADKPHLFTQDRQPERNFLGLPEVSSEQRKFIPIAFFNADIVVSNKVQVIEGATLFHFGMLCSTLHNAWMRAVAGRLESRYSYAPAVYNNFPWPTATDAQRVAIEIAAQAVLDARAVHEGKSLAWLYNPDTMPDNLKVTHAALDESVDAAFGYTGKKDDAARVAFLFGRL